jgi:hypothetical protein
LKVVIKFRLSGSSSSFEPKADHHDLPSRAIAPGTASSASCMGMASPYHQPHEDTHGSVRSENVLHRNKCVYIHRLFAYMDVMTHERCKARRYAGVGCCLLL